MLSAMVSRRRGKCADRIWLVHKRGAGDIRCSEQVVRLGVNWSRQVGELQKALYL